MIAINTFSVVDLLAVVISAHVMLVFLYRSLRVTRRPIDFVCSAMVLLVALGRFAQAHRALSRTERALSAHAAGGRLRRPDRADRKIAGKEALWDSGTVTSARAV